jgi:RNA:NAD 2'-phosphotransferase (TPT1/KptA family)
MVRGLAKLLRHTQHDQMDEAGWMPIQVVADGLHMCPEDIVRAVVADDKGRFETDNDTQRVRAKYGHSVRLSHPYWLDHPVEQNDMVVMHATTVDAWKEIQADGYLRPMERMTIHFTTERELLRHNRHIVLIVDMTEAMKHGIPFYWATKHIIVCPECIPLSYIDFEYMTE